MNDFVHSNDDRPALILNIRDRTGSQLLHGSFENESRLLSEGVCFGARWHISSFFASRKNRKTNAFISGPWKPEGVQLSSGVGESATPYEERVSMWILLLPKAGTRQSDELTLCCKRLQF